MAIRVAINHRTEYRYDRRVSMAPHVFRLRPAPHCRTPIEAYSLNITPKNHFINWQQDPFGNFLARVVFLDKTDRMTVEVDLVANMTVINPFDFFMEEYADKVFFDYEAPLKKELGPCLEIRENGPLLKNWLASVDRTPQNTVDFLVYLNQKLWKTLGYTIRLEAGIQTCEETLRKGYGILPGTRRGSWCRSCGTWGWPPGLSRGYLVQLTADVKSLDGPSGPEADFTDLHAWAEVYVPGAGWIGMDPTSGLFAGEGHIPLACAPDPASAAPVTGATDRV